MKLFYITFRSVTFAQQAERALNSAAIRCTLMRTPKWMEAQGCSYSLRLWTQDIRPALRHLKEAEVPIQRVYVGGRDGQLEEWMP